MSPLPPNPTLKQLDALIGEWEIEVPQFPGSEGGRPSSGSREAPGFWQRFSGTLSDDGSSIRGAWEKSPDGSSWEHDLDLIYTRVK